MDRRLGYRVYFVKIANVFALLLSDATSQPRTRTFFMPKRLRAIFRSNNMPFIAAGQPSVGR